MSITILNGKIDSLSIMKTKLSPPVQQVRSSQSLEIGQLSFLLLNAVDDYKIYIEPNKIFVSLNTPFKKSKFSAINTIVIDPGHGGLDSGIVSYKDVQEKNVTLEIAKRVGSLLENNMSMNVVYTRQFCPNYGTD